MSVDSFYCLEGPLDIVPTGRQMRVANLAGFPALVRRHGGDPHMLLERHGIEPCHIRDPDNFVDSKSVVDLFEYCSTTFNAPLFGLQLAQQQEPDVFGCVTALCRAAPSLREALSCFIDYMPVVHSSAVSLDLVEGKTTVELRWHVHSDLALNSQANYQAALLDIKLLRQIAGARFRPSYVNLAMDTRPKDMDVVEKMLGCGVHNTVGENAIAFPTDVLEHLVSGANRTVFSLLGGYLQKIKANVRVSLIERVNDYVRGALPRGNASIENCAQTLGFSVRTLQVRLSELGSGFTQILEQQRVGLAKIYLQNRRISMNEAAYSLGYSDQTSFGRAFKRWTGITPQDYRAQCAAGSNAGVIAACVVQ